MRKKGIVIFILPLLFILISGCETIKGAFGGATDGARRDWEQARRIDDWMRKNLW